MKWNWVVLWNIVSLIFHIKFLGYQSKRKWIVSITKDFISSSLELFDLIFTITLSMISSDYYILPQVPLKRCHTLSTSWWLHYACPSVLKTLCLVFRGLIFFSAYGFFTASSNTTSGKRTFILARKLRIFSQDVWPCKSFAYLLRNKSHDNYVHNIVVC